MNSVLEGIVSETETAFEEMSEADTPGAGAIADMPEGPEATPPKNESSKSSTSNGQSESPSPDSKPSDSAVSDEISCEH